MKRLYSIAFWAIIVVAFLLRVIPALNNNFYFTMDQGNDAVHSREIWFRHQLILVGPETSIKGFYNGPLWYYFISFGYWFFNGHPIGPIILLVTLNLWLTAFLMKKISQKISFSLAILLGFFLQFYWPFYDTSRYAFNPFPLVAISFLTTIFLIERRLPLAAFILAFPLHTELASFPPLLALYFFIGLWLVLKTNYSFKKFLLGFLIIFLFFIPHFASEIKTNFSQLSAVRHHLFSSSSVFSQNQFLPIGKKFLLLCGESVFHQIPSLGLIIFAFIFYLFWAKKIRPKSYFFARQFIILTILLFSISLVWFGSNKGWSAWQTVYLPPLIFVALLIMIYFLPKKLKLFFLLIIGLSQLNLFFIRYQEYFSPSKDASLLTNELAAIDWVYKEAKDKGFSVYSYLPSVYDYPYQYLFWWYGQRKYGYLPCEYASFPGAPGLFIPGRKYYQEPKKECQNLRFLIIEPDKNLVNQDQWFKTASQKTTLLEKTYIGKIRVEKRLISR